MNVIKSIAAFMLIVVVLMVFSVATGLFGLEYKKFFSPRNQNIERQVFEETQSYVHGKTKDLAKYFEEYRSAESKDREAIRQFILMNFSDFNAEKITTPQLRNFLIQMRGY